VCMKVDIQKIAKLANIPLNQEEQELLEPQLREIIKFVEKLNEVDTSNIPPTAQVTGKINEFRADRVGDQLSQSASLANAPNTQDGFIVTKGVFDDR